MLPYNIQNKTNNHRIKEKAFMSKIVVLLGSPRKNGNTELLVNLVNGVEDKGAIKDNEKLKDAYSLGLSIKMQ